MPSPQSDFAHPVAKTAGCFVALSALPIVASAHVFGPHPLPWTAFAGATLLMLAGLGTLCGKRNTIVEVVRSLRAILSRERDL